MGWETKKELNNTRTRRILLHMFPFPTAFLKQNCYLVGIKPGNVCPDMRVLFVAHDRDKGGRKHTTPSRAAVPITNAVR